MWTNTENKSEISTVWLTKESGIRLLNTLNELWLLLTLCRALPLGGLGSLSYNFSYEDRFWETTFFAVLRVGDQLCYLNIFGQS